MELLDDRQANRAAVAAKLVRYRLCLFGFHSRLSFRASAIWARIILFPIVFLLVLAPIKPCAAARFHHMKALTLSVGTPSPLAYTQAKAYSEIAKPWSAPFLYQFAASTWSFGTPSLLEYSTPKLYCPLEFPCSAASYTNSLFEQHLWELHDRRSTSHPIEFLLRLALLSRLFVPVHRLGVVLRNAGTLLVECAQVDLRFSISSRAHHDESL